MSTNIMQSLTFITFTASKKIAMLNFLPCTDNWLAIPRPTLIITQTHIFHASHKIWVWFLPRVQGYTYTQFLAIGRVQSGHMDRQLGTTVSVIKAMNIFTHVTKISSTTMSQQHRRKTAKSFFKKIIIIIIKSRILMDVGYRPNHKMLRILNV